MPQDPSRDERPVSDDSRHDSRREHAPRGRPKTAWTSVTVGVILVVLLVVFIAQNTQKVNVSFLWLDGDVPLAVSLLASAVMGAVIVLLVGTIRVTQLRLAERRQRRHNVDSR